MTLANIGRWGRRAIAGVVLGVLAGLMSLRADEPPDGWRIRLQVTRAGLDDSGSLTLGSASAALDGYDAFDDPHPPEAPFERLDVFTRHERQEPGWEGQRRDALRYRRQFDAPLGDADGSRLFTVESDQPGPVRLSWELLADLELGTHFATLVDLQSGTSTDMWSVGHYDFVAAAGARQFRIDLVAGRTAPPVAISQSLTVPQDGSAPVTLTALDPEGDALTFAVADPPMHGALAGTAPELVYFPEPGYSGPDRFTFVASDGGSNSAPGVISIHVLPANRAPLAFPDAVTTSEDAPVEVHLIASDADGDALGYEIVAPPAHGVLSGTPPDMTYTPQPGFYGDDSFSFRVSDGSLTSAPAAVSVSVTSVNDEPLADFSVPGPERNVALWRNNLAAAKSGGVVAAVSSQAAGNPATNLLDEQPATRWVSAGAQPGGEFVTLAWPHLGLARVAGVRIVNADASAGQAVKRFEARVSSTTTDAAAFTTVLAETLLDNGRVQEFRFGTPVDARYVQLRVLDLHGSGCCASLRDVEVLPVDVPGLPSLDERPQNAAALSELARVVSVTSQNAALPASAALDGNVGTRWESAAGQATNQALVVELGRARIYPIERVRFSSGGSSSTTWVRNFRVELSATTADDAAFSTVFTGVGAQTSGNQEFVLPGGPRDARYVRFTALDSHGGTCCVSLSELALVPAALATRSVSSYRDANARPELALDRASSGWVSAQGQVTDQFMILRLDEQAGTLPLVERVRLDTVNAGNEGVRDFSIALSTTSNEPAAFTTVLEATQPVSSNREHTLPGGPRRARFLRLFMRNTHGSSLAMRLGKFEALTTRGDSHVVSILAEQANVLRQETPSLPANGAALLRSSGSTNTLNTPLAMLAHGGVGWRTPAVAGQYAVVALGGAAPWTLTGVDLVSPVGNDGVRAFEVWLSATGSEDADFTRVLSATATNDGTLRRFDFVATAARFVKYVPLTNYGNAFSISTTGLAVRAREAGGLISASAFVSAADRPENALDGDGNTRWGTPALSEPRRIKVRLAGGALWNLQALRIHPLGGNGPRDFDVRVSTSGEDDAAFTTILSGTLPSTDQAHEITLPTLTPARYLEFVWRSAYGPANVYVRELNALAVQDAAAVLLGSSGAGTGSQSPAGALDLDRLNGTWATADGQKTDQWFKLALPDGRAWRLDQLALQPAPNCCDDRAPRAFELQTSATGYADADFQTVFTGLLRNDRSLQFFSLPRGLRARYVRFLVRDVWGGNGVTLGTFWLISPELGGPQPRFLDRSLDSDGRLTSWRWAFGDGGEAQERDPLHLYAAAGTYGVSLAASDDSGGVGSAGLSYRVFGAPQADFTFAPALPGERDNVVFSDASRDPLGTPVFFEWTYGDGNAGSGATASRVNKSYDDNGTYNASLRVTNRRGLTATASHPVTIVNRPPSASLGPDLSIGWGVDWNTAASVSDPSPIDAQSLTCEWNFGDGQSATISNCTTFAPRVPHPYPEFGVYTATLTVRDKDGGVGSDSVNVTVVKRNTAIRLCAPLTGTTGLLGTVEVTAKLDDLSLPGTAIAGRRIRFDVDGQVSEVLTDADGVAWLPLELPVGAQAQVRASFVGDERYTAAAQVSAVARVVAAPPSVGRDAWGNDFWLAFPRNDTPRSTSLSLFITSEHDTQGTVSIPALGVCQAFSVASAQVVEVPVANTANVETADGIEAKGIHVTSLRDVMVYGLNRQGATTDAYLGLPSDALGTEHVVLAYRNQPIVDEGGSQITVVASQNDTHVTIVPAATTPPHQAGVPYNVVLQRGQTYQLRNVEPSPADLSGTIVTSSKPVTVFGGHMCGNVTNTCCCDHMVEQIPPVDTWGQSFVSIPLATRGGTDTYRVIAAQDGTTVRLNGAVVGLLARGQVLDRLVQGPAHFTADKPVLVAQYANSSGFNGTDWGDPFMMVIPSHQQFQAAYSVTTPSANSGPWFSHHVNIVIPTAAAGSVTLDGVAVPAASFTPIAASGYSGASVQVAAGAHRLTSATPFGVAIYGWGVWDSYGYFGGQGLGPVASVAAVHLEPRSENALPGTSRCVDAAVTDAGGQPLADVRVDFSVTGANPRSGFGFSDAAGISRYCYTGSTTGFDNVRGSVGTVSDVVTKTWVANGAPTANAQALTTAEDTALPITLTGSDPDGDALTYVVLTQPAHGSLSGTAPALTYTPAADFAGTDAFTFRVNDGTADSPAATISITVTPANDPPTANPQSLTTAEDTALPITLTGSDPDGDTLTYVVLTQPAHGSLSGTAPALTYTPVADFAGADSFTFRVNDGTADSPAATITITVTPANDPPTANAQSLTTAEDTALPITLTASDPDGDTLTYVVLTQPTHGSLSGTAPALTYTPAADFAGADNFTFRVNDGTADSPAATISITVTPANDPPTANPQSLTTAEDTALPITLTGSDPDGDTLTYVVLTQPAHGSLSGTAPALTYTPAADFAGDDAFTFRVNDGTADSPAATISITVTPANDPPTANAQSLTTAEDTALPITLTGSDPDGDTLTYVVLTQPAHGSLSGTAPALTYTPAADFAGADSFTFRVNDGTADSPAATISITVTPANDPPTANAQSLTTAEDTALPITLTASDPDGDALTYIVLTQPAHGSLSGTAPALTYTPAADFAGADSFTFRVNDGTADSPAATITITVTPANDPPTANPQSLTTAEDTALPITLTGSDPDGDDLTYVVLTQPTHGSLSGTAPALTYTPAADFAGADSFTFRVNDGTADSPAATISITVTPANDPPIANPQSLTTAEDTALPVTLTGSDPDGDTLTYVVLTQPAHGALSGTAPALTYTPAADFAGADAFTFRVNDGTADSPAATISITVTPANDPPTANPQSLTTAEDTALPITLTGSDPDGDALTYVVLTQPVHGLLSGTAPALTYTPAADFAGADSFTFRVDDGTADSPAATISITVTPANDPPTANPQSLTTAEDTALPITLTASDPDGDTLTYVVLTQPAHGSLSGTAPALTYTPAADFAGADSFTFRVNDGTADSPAATISITVTPANDPPTANAQSLTTAEDTALPITLTGSDPDGDALTYVVLTQPTHGALSGTAPALTYTPAADFAGADSFTFRVNDGTADSPAATITITVTPANDPPTANAQSLTTAEDTALPITLTGSDPDGDDLTYVVLTQPTHGSLSGTAPALTYTPAPDFAGADSFTFRVNDGTTDSPAATISIIVTPTNDPPTANAQSLTTAEDTALPVTLTGSDPDGDTLTYVVLTQPAHGSLSGTAPALTYTPAADFAGADSFTFRVNDGTADSPAATISITVTPANDPPTANPQSLTTAEDTALPITLTGSDPDGDTLTYVVLTQPAHGSLSGTAPALTYTPAADFAGADAFTFRVNDGTADSPAATISITVTPANDPPTANPQSLTTAEDTALPITLTGSDPDGDDLTYVVLTQPTHGSLSGTAPALTYTPAADFAGADSFTFRVNDGTADSPAATVTITVTPAGNNTPPKAKGQYIEMAEDTPQSVTLLAWDDDGDPLTYTVVEGPFHGTLTGVAPDLVYTPPANYHGPDVFTFKASDGQSESEVAQVSFSIEPVNDAPVASAASVTTVVGTPVAVHLTATDVDGDDLTFEIVAAPQHGLLSGTAPDLTYTPQAGYTGADEISFRASDGVAFSAPARVDVHVVPEAARPVAHPATVKLLEDTEASFALEATHPDGLPLTFVILAPPAHGTLSGSAPLLVYTPAENFSGIDTLTFKVTDGVLESSPAQVTFEVAPLNDVPVTKGQYIEMAEDTPQAVTLLAWDDDGDDLTYTLVEGPFHGALTGVAPHLVYTPPLNYNGPDVFTFKVSDGQSESEVAQVSFSIEPVNDAPTASDQQVTTDFETPVPVTLGASDVDGDDLTFELVSQPQHGTLAGGDSQYTYAPQAGHVGADSFTYRVGDGQSMSALATVHVLTSPPDDAPPDCSQALPSVTTLWPPNHGWRSVEVRGVTDAQGHTATVTVTGVLQDEPVRAAGSGNTGPDAKLAPLKLRAERVGSGDGRVYHVAFSAMADNGRSCTGAVTVCVPHDMGAGARCVDGGPLYDATASK